MFDLKNALLLLFSDNNLCCASFPGNLVIGAIDQETFIQNQYFEFTKSDLRNLYKAVIEIVACIAKNTEKKDAILKKEDESIVYFWSFSNTTVYIGIETISTTTYKIPFSLDEFNDFVLILSKLIMPTLCLKSEPFLLLEFVSDFPPKEFLALKDFADVLKFLHSKKYNLFDSTFATYILYYKEILLIVSMLKSLHNQERNNMSDLLKIGN